MDTAALVKDVQNVAADLRKAIGELESANSGLLVSMMKRLEGHLATAVRLQSAAQLKFDKSKLLEDQLKKKLAEPTLTLEGIKAVVQSAGLGQDFETQIRPFVTQIAEANAAKAAESEDRDRELLIEISKLGPSVEASAEAAVATQKGLMSTQVSVKAAEESLTSTMQKELDKSNNLVLERGAETSAKHAVMLWNMEERLSSTLLSNQTTNDENSLVHERERESALREMEERLSNKLISTIENFDRKVHTIQQTLLGVENASSALNRTVNLEVQKCNKVVEALNDKVS